MSNTPPLKYIYKRYIPQFLWIKGSFQNATQNATLLHETLQLLFSAIFKNINATQNATTVNFPRLEALFQNATNLKKPNKKQLSKPSELRSVAM